MACNLFEVSAIKLWLLAKECLFLDRGTSIVEEGEGSTWRKSFFIILDEIPLQVSSTCLNCRSNEKSCLPKSLKGHSLNRPSDRVEDSKTFDTWSRVSCTVVLARFDLFPLENSPSHAACVKMLKIASHNMGGIVSTKMSSYNSMLSMNLLYLHQLLSYLSSVPSNLAAAQMRAAVFCRSTILSRAELATCENYGASDWGKLCMMTLLEFRPGYERPLTRCPPPRWSSL